MAFYDMYNTNAEQMEILRNLILEAFAALLKQHEEVKHVQEREREVKTITENGKYTFLRMENANAVATDAFLDYCGIEYERLDLDKGNFQYKIKSEDYKKVMDNLYKLKEGKITAKELEDAYRNSGRHSVNALDEILKQYNNENKDNEQSEPKEDKEPVTDEEDRDDREQDLDEDKDDNLGPDEKDKENEKDILNDEDLEKEDEEESNSDKEEKKIHSESEKDRESENDADEREYKQDNEPVLEEDKNKPEEEMTKEKSSKDEQDLTEEDSPEEDLTHEIDKNEDMHELNDNAEWNRSESEDEYAAEDIESAKEKSAETDKTESSFYSEEDTPDISESRDEREEESYSDTEDEKTSYEEEEYPNEDIHEEDSGEDYENESHKEESHDFEDKGTEYGDSREERAEEPVAESYSENTPVQETEYTNEDLSSSKENDSYNNPENTYEQKSEESYKQDTYENVSYTNQSESSSQSQENSYQKTEEYHNAVYEEEKRIQNECLNQDRHSNDSATYKSAGNADSASVPVYKSQDYNNTNNNSTDNSYSNNSGSGNSGNSAIPIPVPVPMGSGNGENWGGGDGTGNNNASDNGGNSTTPNNLPNGGSSGPNGSNNENNSSGSSGNGGYGLLGDSGNSNSNTGSLFDNAQNMNLRKINYDNGYLGYRDGNLYEKAFAVMNSSVRVGASQSDVGAGWHSMDLVRAVIGTSAVNATADGMRASAREKLNMAANSGSVGMSALNSFIAQGNSNGVFGKLDFSSEAAARASNIAVMETLKKKGLVTGNAKNGYDTRKLEFFMGKAASGDQKALDKLNKILGLRVASANDKYGLSQGDINKLYAQIVEINNYGKATGQNHTKNMDVSGGKHARTRKVMSVMTRSNMKQTEVYKGYQSTVSVGRSIGRTFVAVKMVSGYVGRKIYNSRPVKVARKAVSNTALGKGVINLNKKVSDFKERHGRAARETRRLNRRADRIKRIKDARVNWLAKQYKKSNSTFSRRFIAGRINRIRNPKASVYSKFKAKLFGLKQSLSRAKAFIIKYVVIGLGAFLLLAQGLLLLGAVVGTVTTFFDGLVDAGTDKDYEVKDIWWDKANEITADLRYAEAEWMDQLKKGGIEATKSEGRLDVFFYGPEYQHIVNYAEEHLGLHSGYDNDEKAGQKYYIIGSNPFPDVLSNEAASALGINKHINTLDGRVYVEYENASGQSHHTSNIKEIICMSNVFYDMDSNLDDYEEASDAEYEETSKNPPTGFKKVLSNIGNGFKFVICYLPNLVGNWAEKNATEKTLLNYCTQLFNISHQERYDLKYESGIVEGLLDKEDPGTAALLEAKKSGAVFFCPEKNGCSTYGNFYYNDNGGICIKDGSEKKSLEGKILYDKNDRCIPLTEERTAKEVAKSICNHTDCWTLCGNLRSENNKFESTGSTSVSHETNIGSLTTDWSETGRTQTVTHEGDYSSGDYSELFRQIIKQYSTDYANKEILGVYVDTFHKDELVIDFGTTVTTITEKKLSSSTPIPEGPSAGKYAVQTRVKTVTKRNRLRFVHTCSGTHSGSFCGGHLSFIVTGIVYGFTEEQLGDREVEGSVGEVVSKVTDDYVPEKTDKTYVKHFILDDIHDIFDADSKIVRKVTSDRWQGWNEENMELAIIKYNMDWNSLYGFDFGQEMDGISLTEDQILEYLAKCAKLLGESEDYEAEHGRMYKAIEKMLRMVGNYLYAETHSTCIPTCCNSETGRNKGGICNFGVTEGYMTIYQRALVGKDVLEVLSMDTIYAECTSVPTDVDGKYLLKPGDIIKCANNGSVGIIVAETPETEVSEWYDSSTGETYITKGDAMYYYITFRRNTASKEIDDYTSLGIEQICVNDMSSAYRPKY